MKILIIADSPSLLTRNGAIHKTLLDSLPSAGHSVDSIVYQHNLFYCLPNELGQFRYKNSTIYPFIGEQKDIGVFAYETMKKVQPNLVISVGTAEEIGYVSAIKSLYPNIFKWLVILTGSSTIHSKNKERLECADKVITLNKEHHTAFNQLCSTKATYLPFGYDSSKFYNLHKREEFQILNCAKNKFSSNLPVFIDTCFVSKVKATLHTNISDDGDYDISELKKPVNLKLPDRFTSIIEGLSAENMNDLYNRHYLYIDCCMQSVSSLCLLEAMGTGCLPIAPAFGRAKNIMMSLPEDIRFIIPHEVYVGKNQEEFAVVSVKSIVSIVNELKEKIAVNGWFKSVEKELEKLSIFLTKDNFIRNINTIVESLISQEHVIVVDTF